MSKPTEKEPLLFVDTNYKGCFVNEQSFFKTPSRKTENISLSNYVHNYDEQNQMNDNELLQANHVEITDTGISSNVKDDLDDDLDDINYETINIFVDQIGIEETDNQNESTDFFNEPISIKPIEDLSYLEELTIEESVLEPEVFSLAPVMESSVRPIEVLDEPTGIFPNQEVVEVSNPVSVLDEKQQELLLFIQDLTDRPSMMKAPIVQVVLKDGALKSGMIGLVSEQTISVDNMMDEVEQFSIADIQGIRILHL